MLLDRFGPVLCGVRDEKIAILPAFNGRQTDSEESRGILCPNSVGS